MSAAPDSGSTAAPLPAVSIQELANRLARVERVMGIVRLAQPPMTNIDLGRLRVGAIVEAVAHEMGVSPMRICSADRSHPAFRARAACCWLAKRLTAHSLAMIGGVIQRDHSTVLNAIRQADALRANDPAFRMVTERLLRQFAPLQEATTTGEAS